mmetsp:Transcript_8777/g.33128  ORF Transcript_8777/g.33128 Transcript_8777/m.33128 type:complete len:113 (-) Transcript_8777:223-561(-)
MLRSVLSRPVWMHARPLALRSMSTDAAKQTFRDVFKKYYDDNYRNALFSRMKKDVIRATDANSDGFISEEELRALLGNIGANMEENDIKAVMSLGNSDGKGIPNTTFLKLLD